MNSALMLLLILDSGGDAVGGDVFSGGGSVGIRPYLDGLVGLSSYGGSVGAKSYIEGLAGSGVYLSGTAGSKEYLPGLGGSEG